MRTFFFTLLCFVLLTVNYVTAQETFAPLITENCIAFVHFDFKDIEFDKRFHNAAIPQYRCPSNPLYLEPNKNCCYAGIAGESFVPTAKENIQTGHRLLKLTDGTSNTLGVIEVKEPFCRIDPTADITLNELIKGINNEGRCGSFHRGGYNAVMFDGLSRFLSDSIDPQTLRKSGDIDDGESVRLH